MENKARIVNILLDKYVLETENGECIEAIIRKNAKTYTRFEYSNKYIDKWIWKVKWTRR